MEHRLNGSKKDWCILYHYGSVFVSTSADKWISTCTHIMLTLIYIYIPLLTVGGAGVIVRPAFWVNARRSRTVAFDNDTASRPMLKSTTSSTSIFSMVLDWICVFRSLSLSLSLPLPALYCTLLLFLLLLLCICPTAKNIMNFSW